ncbi:MAG TPA: hypothetical protein VNM48_20355 [Chloroflexota bacterium]|nr:hypothetical protein [Chloroflexota bacterium]
MTTITVRRPFRPIRDPADDAADRRIEAWYWNLPHSVREAVDARVGWHLLLGGGCSSEALLLDAIRQSVTAGGQS